MTLIDDSAWFCMEKLKKHSFETQKYKNKTQNTPRISKSTETIPLLGPFKGPCTLP